MKTTALVTTMFLMLFSAACREGEPESNRQEASSLNRQSFIDPSLREAPEQLPLHDFTLCWLQTGPRARFLAEKEKAALGTGHMMNIRKLAEQGKLLVAGPYGARVESPPFRGLFIFDEAKPSFARVIAKSDPAVAAGLMSAEVLAFKSVESLRAINAWHKAGVGDSENQFQYMRAYVLLDAEIPEDGDPHEIFGDRLAGLERLWEGGKILCFGRYKKRDADRILLVLNATKVEPARALFEKMTERKTLLNPIFHPWYASEAVALIPEAIKAEME